VKGGAGRDAVDPRILLALWLFATVEGVGSARRLAELCGRDLAYQWMCGEVGVNRDLLNTFRSRHPEALDALMTETIGILLHHDLVSLTRVAQDGMRVRAAAGKSSFHRQATLEKHLEEARRQVEQMRQEGDDEDAGRSRQEAARQRAAEQRLQRLEQAIAERDRLHEQKEQQQRNTGAQARASTTDPEARTMKMADGGYRPAYNVQFATAADSRLIVGVAVTNEGGDSGQMAPMVTQLEEKFGTRPAEYLVDGGFSSREDTTRLEQQGVKVYSPVKKEQKLLEQGQDPYARRRGDSDEYYAYRQRMQTPEAKTIYQQRCSTAEFPNAGCRNRGLHQFPVRGLRKVRTIALWQALVHNFRMILYHGWLTLVCRGQC
jgi:transposase